MITSYLNEKITDKNLIYCSTFQLVWNQLIENYTREPVKLEIALKIVDELNKQSFVKDHLSDDCYLTLSGFSRDGIVQKIKQQLKEKFNETSQIQFETDRPDDIIIYAFLLKIIQFAKKFDKTSIYWSGKDIRAFGFADDNPDMELKKQVKILHYNTDDDFSIQLITEQEDVLVLAKIEPKDTLEETVSYVESLRPFNIELGLSSE